MCPDNPVAEAVAIGADGRILAVGCADEAASAAGGGAVRIDLGGRTAIPGFFDCHMHILWLGLNLGQVDLSEAGSAHDIVTLLRKRLAERPDAPCVLGSGYNQNRLPGCRHITRADLDAVAMDRPVRIEHASGHAAVVNTCAVQRLGITATTHDPPGGSIERDERGEATGVLLETASWQDLHKILPEVTDEAAAAAIDRASAYLLARGVTSATDANTTPSAIAGFARALETGALRVRTNLMVAWPEVCRDAGSSTPAPDDLQPSLASGGWHMLHVGQAKLFSDGAITTRTCWLTAPFTGSTDNYGIPIHETEELRELIFRAHDAGWQIATHAIGDRAIDEVLHAYAEAQRRNPRYHPGHRIEHCMLLNHALIAALRRQNVWSIGQPEFLYALGDAYVAALGEERAALLSPYASLEQHGVAQAFSSDCPVVRGAPLDGLRAAMSRSTVSGRVLGTGERLPADTALFNYTAAPAYATRTERDRGTLEAGKWADLTVLSADPVATPLDQWEQVQVEATIVGGRALYGADCLEGATA